MPTLTIEHGHSHQADVRVVTLTIHNETHEPIPAGYGVNAFEVFTTHRERLLTYHLSEPLMPGMLIRHTFASGHLVSGAGKLIAEPTGDSV